MISSAPSLIFVQLLALMFAKYAKIPLLRYSYKVTENGCSGI